MGGNYQNSKNSIEKSLIAWVNEVISEERWRDCYDIHIDEISNIFKKRNSWLEGAIYAFDCLLSLIDVLKYEVFLAIPIESYEKQFDVKKLLTIDSLKNEIHLTTPPSFYLFPMGYEMWNEAKENSVKYFLTYNDKAYNAFFSELIDGFEYNRTVFISSNFNYTEILKQAKS